MHSLIVPVMDARRNQVYTCVYEWQGPIISRLTDYAAEDINIILARLPEFNRKAIFLGDGVLAYRALLEQQADTSIAPDHLLLQRASSAAGLAFLLTGSAIESNNFVPFYLRQSQAERELLKTHGG
jgi:tRNA threonylcarbamoyladenosine biosynthesis protein TsaB